MPLTFDLSGIQQTRNETQQTLQQAPIPTSPGFTFTIGAASAASAASVVPPSLATPSIGLVRRSVVPSAPFAAPFAAPPAPFSTHPTHPSHPSLPPPPRIGEASNAPYENGTSQCQRADDEENDQYTIRPGRSMCWSVLCRNDTGRRHPKSLLGDFGHAERLPAWLHLVASAAFGVYGVLRPTLITQQHTIAESWTTVSVFATAFCFASSTVYHVTSPSKRLAYFTRQLDFAGIYTAIALGYVADYAIATRSFNNTSILSVIDGPLACVITLCFFLARRGLLPSSDTWSAYLGGCTVNFGLFRRMHVDKAHTGTRQATSFILAIAAFVSAPSLFKSIGTENALVVVGLEVACFALLVVGMSLDNAGTWPDANLSAGRGPSVLVCKPCGCVGSAHALWHGLTIAAAVKVAVGRELALQWS